MKSFFKRFRFAWKILFSQLYYQALQSNLFELQRIRPLAAKWEEVAFLLRSPFGVAAKYAVEKVANDPSFHSTKDHFIKRKEAEEWAGHYLKDAGKLYSAWDVNFLIELIIGMRKGRL